MARYNHIDHALHNEKVCNFISKKEDYSDWIITTAFYSAIHFVRHLMIPVIMPNGDIKNCFEDFFTCQRSGMEGRHGFQNRYVSTNLKTIAVEYKQLHDWCNQARYFEYNQPRVLSKQAKENLMAIKQHVISIKK